MTRQVVPGVSLLRSTRDGSAVLLIAGDKSGGDEKRFYLRLIAKADERFDEHLSQTKNRGI